jgi:hypothetical protein
VELTEDGSQQSAPVETKPVVEMPVAKVEEKPVETKPAVEAKPFTTSPAETIKAASKSRLIAQIHANFSTYHLDPMEGAKCEKMRIKFREMALMIIDTCPESREQSLAITKLEEAMMWACVSVPKKAR